MSLSMSSQILIFLDHRGNERFFLRRRGAAADLQRWLAHCAVRIGAGTAWSTLKLAEI